MSIYHAPLAEMRFVLDELAGLDQVAGLPGFDEATPDVVTAILDEAAKFATNVLDPLNAVGDREGAQRLPDGTVQTPAGFSINDAGQFVPEETRAPFGGDMPESYIQAVPSSIYSGSNAVQRDVLATRGLGLPRG